MKKDVKKYDKSYIKYNKLVRDKIPQIIEKTDKVAKYRILTDSKYFAELKKKLQEEVLEFIEDETVEELADINEVIEAILEYKNISKNWTSKGTNPSG